MAEYIALRRMMVHVLDAKGEPKLGEDGRPILRQLAPGDPIPEAESWSNLWREVRAGRVGLAGTALTGPALADSMRRKVADSGRPARPTRKRPAKTAERPRSRTAAEAEPAPDPEAEPEQPVADVAPRSAGAEADPERESAEG